MTLDEILAGLFPAGHDVVVRPDKLILGAGRRRNGGTIEVIGIADGEPLGVAGVFAARRAGAAGDRRRRRDADPGDGRYARPAHGPPRRDAGSQRVSRPSRQVPAAGEPGGHRTVGLDYGKAAAGAFLATALATDVLVALPGAEPWVMDLPSMARVTKLPEEQLTAMAKTTPVFAPGVEAMRKVGAVAETWEPGKPLDAQLEATLAKICLTDERDVLGAARGGRRVAADVARRTAVEATGTRHAAAS